MGSQVVGLRAPTTLTTVHTAWPRQLSWMGLLEASLGLKVFPETGDPAEPSSGVPGTLSCGTEGYLAELTCSNCPWYR